MKTLTLMTIAFLLLPAYSVAEEGRQSNRLSMQTCIDKTLAAHPDIKRLYFEMEQKSAAVTSGKAANLPQIFVSAEYDPIKTFVIPQNGRFLTDDHDAWRAGLGLSQKIYDFGSTKGRIKASEFSRESAALSLKEAKRLLIYQVETLYDTILLQKTAMKATDEDIKTKEALYRQAQELVKNGMKTRADEASLLASLYNAKDAYSGATAAFLKAKVLMELYIGETILPETEYEDLLEKRSLIKVGPEEENALKASLLGNNSKMQIQTQAIGESEALLEVAEGERYGTIDAVASYSRESNLSDYDVTMAGIRLEIPIFTGGHLKAKVARAKMAALQAKEAYASQKLKLLSEFEGALIDLRRAEASMEAKKAGMTAAREASDLMAARYREGLSTYIEVLDAAARYLEAKLGLWQARYNKSSAIYYIDYLSETRENTHE